MSSCPEPEETLIPVVITIVDTSFTEVINDKFQGVGELHARYIRSERIG